MTMDDFTIAYIEAALWSSTTEDETPMDEVYDVYDIEAESLLKIQAECAEFQAKHAGLLTQAGTSEQNGHDFWLTRNHHGAGYWDRGYPKHIGDALTKSANKAGERCLYIAGGKVHYDRA